MGIIDRRLQALRDIKLLQARHKRRGVEDMDEESMTEPQFVRAFGTKVKIVHLSHRLDMVGLMIAGRFNGILITRGGDKQRRVRAVDIIDGKMHVTQRFLVLKDKDSLSNLQRGLLNWVQ